MEWCKYGYDDSTFHYDMEQEQLHNNEIKEQTEPEPFQWWVMKDGNRIHISNMTIIHLGHCINKIKKTMWRLEWLTSLTDELKSR